LSLESLEDRYLLSLRFAPAVTFPVGIRPESIVTADLGNGHQDIVVVNQGDTSDFQSSVSVLLGNGDGTFQPAITTNVLPGADSVAVGDFHGDGHLDLVLANRLTDVVEVLRGNGDGTFQGNPTLLPIPPNHANFPLITSVAVGDFRHNGKLDIAATSAASNTVSVFLGNGDGAFQDRVDFAVGANPESVVAADLGNGQVDLVVANHDSSDVSVLLGNGDGSFQRAQNIDVNAHINGIDSNPITLAVGDFNGDGKPDIFVSQAEAFFEGVVTVLPGNGDGTFQAPMHINVGFGFLGPAVADFNGDGTLDFATTDQNGPTAAAVFLGNGDGTFGHGNRLDSGGGPTFGITAGDVTGDGRPALVVANTFTNTVGVLLNTSTVATTTTLSADVNRPDGHARRHLPHRRGPHTDSRLQRPGVLRRQHLGRPDRDGRPRPHDGCPDHVSRVRRGRCAGDLHGHGQSGGPGDGYSHGHCYPLRPRHRAGHGAARCQRPGCVHLRL
jgi:hypothetical protein